MLTPVVETVGIGFMLEGKDESVRFGHGGANEGFLSQMTLYKDHGMGAVVMINANEGGPMLREIERAIAREYNWPDSLTEERKAAHVSTEVLEMLVGDYAGKSGFKCTITRRNEQVFLKFDAQPPIELLPESETRFFMTLLNGTSRLSGQKKGQ